MAKNNTHQIYESIMRKMSHNVIQMMLNENFSGFSLIKPSVLRWIDDRESDTPQDRIEIREFLNAKDPGYRLMTVRNQKIVQDLINAYLNDNVAWINQNFETTISSNDRLGLISYAYGSIPVVVYFIDYDYDASFLENIENLYTDAAIYLSEFETQESFDKCCYDAEVTAEESGASVGYIYNPFGE